MPLRKQIEIIIDELLDGRILLGEAVAEFEKLYIEKALTRNSYHVSNTAAALGIHRNTLAKRLSSYKAPAAVKKRPINGRAKKKAAGK